MSPVWMAFLSGILVGLALFGAVLLVGSAIANWRADRRAMRHGAPLEISARVLMKRAMAAKADFARRRALVEKRWKP